MEPVAHCHRQVHQELLQFLVQQVLRLEHLVLKEQMALMVQQVMPEEEAGQVCQGQLALEERLALPESRQVEW